MQRGHLTLWGVFFDLSITQLTSEQSIPWTVGFQYFLKMYFLFSGMAREDETRRSILSVFISLLYTVKM